MGFVSRVLQPSGIPLTTRQFWWYAFLYWIFFGMIWYSQATMVWLLTPNGRMYYTETLYWLIELLYWWGATPLIIYFAQRFPLQNYRKSYKLIGHLLIHLLIVSVLYAFELVIEYSLLGAAMAYERGDQITLRRVVMVFFMSYGTAFGQYMLLVVCYNVLIYVYRFQSLKQQHLSTELTNAQLKGQLANAQLQTLKMQLNPHFLFNTLHTIVSLMICNQTKRATLMVVTLSDLLRTVLARQEANALELQEELQLTKQYLAIQQIRFEDRLKIEYAIEPGTERWPVPQLILQPLVENAITHGIANLATEALIRISSRRCAEGVEIEVFDNGLGEKKKQSTSGTGLGLSNTLLRLEQMYGQTAHLRFEQPPGGTTTVSVLIPDLATSEHKAY
ncbi:sensor histidine kinase [Tellurirhabdus bombi]|uniref:sensor histidine kinase n=1 Tax=Tellurirhabdus bombi TaxID=2907205 RepID=UPI001F378C1D|nr:histidine kinase [Tellurirhabdus bombi]